MITARTVTTCALICICISAVFFGCNTHSRAKEIMKQEKCFECHTIKGVGGSVGPNLTNVGYRRSADFIIQQIRDPKSHNPNTQMPSFKDLPDQDLKNVVNYLTSLK